MMMRRTKVIFISTIIFQLDMINGESIITSSKVTEPEHQLYNNLFFSLRFFGFGCKIYILIESILIRKPLIARCFCLFLSFLSSQPEYSHDDSDCVADQDRKVDSELDPMPDDGFSAHGICSLLRLFRLLDEV